MITILGISGFFHDSAASLIIDGKIVAAFQEERFTRKKHDASFPKKAIAACLATAKIKPQNIDYVCFYDKPFLKFERLLETYIGFAPAGVLSFARAMPSWLREKLFLKDILLKECKKLKIKIKSDKYLFSEHHISHAASAFYPSPFEKAFILVVDGVGEWATLSLCFGDKNKITPIKEICFPHSLGLLYSAFTYYLGFRVNSGEYKMMGLAPYGKPIYCELITKHFFHQFKDGSFFVNQKYFSYAHGLRMTNGKFDKIMGGRPRKENQPITQKHMDIAASIQKITEDAMLTIVDDIATNYQQEYDCQNLTMAGGVALNCVANGKIAKSGKFNLWIQPAAGDAGGSLGCALHAYHHHLDKQRLEPAKDQQDNMQGSYLGNKFTDEEIESCFSKLGASFTKFATDELIDITANAIAKGNSVGWFQGRMEFGPRALGNRSIIADPRGTKVQAKLNLQIKYRESFRPFAPAVLAEECSNWFDLDLPSPYMLLVAKINQDKSCQDRSCQDRSCQDKSLSQEENSNSQKNGFEKLQHIKSQIPAVTHVDYSARVQSVHKHSNALFHALISKFKEITGCPILVNTSFNVRGEPIVCTPEDAYRCFMGTELDMLVCGNFILYKNQQAEELKQNYKSKFALD